MDMILSIDLSGPSSPEKTGVAWFETRDDNLEFSGSRIGATDSDIAELAEELASSGDLLVGMDAPLAYEPGGGSRASDTELREKLQGLGAHPGTVMAPTAYVVAACAGALATWDWGLQRSPWITPAAPPAHPFDFAG